MSEVTINYFLFYFIPSKNKWPTQSCHVMDYIKKNTTFSAFTSAQFLDQYGGLCHIFSSIIIIIIIIYIIFFGEGWGIRTFLWSFSRVKWLAQGHSDGGSKWESIPEPLDRDPLFLSIAQRITPPSPHKNTFYLLCTLHFNKISVLFCACGKQEQRLFIHFHWGLNKQNSTKWALFKNVFNLRSFGGKQRPLWCISLVWLHILPLSCCLHWPFLTW